MEIRLYKIMEIEVTLGLWWKLLYLYKFKVLHILTILSRLGGYNGVWLAISSSPRLRGSIFLYKPLQIFL
jgi:hypothetical protein